ncbi:MAG: DnaA N-terminal domain-containing protein, partial [Candidatus Acidiferrales bacterium]
ANDTWQRCLETLKKQIPAHEFLTYLRPLQLVLQDGAWELLAPNEFICERVPTYLPQIRQALREIAPDTAPERIAVTIGAVGEPACR